MRNIRWQLLIAVGGLILVLGLLVGQTPDTETYSSQPAVGGVYIEALVGEIQRLNPILDVYNQVDRDIDRIIFSGLIRFDERGLPVPELADWTVTADATIYTVTIREGAVWHDGEPVSADDIIYTFSKFQDDDYPGPEDLHELWKQVNIIRLDDRQVQFQLPEPFAPFLDYLSVGLLPDHHLRGVSASGLVDHPFNLQPIGTGPFRFDRFLVQDDQIIGVSLVAFEQYFDQRPYLERVEFRVYPDSTTAFTAFTDGEVQGIAYIDEEILPQVLDSPELNLHTARLPSLGIIFINTQHAEKEFLGNKQFRQALQLAINRQYIIDQALSGQGLLPIGPVLPGTWSYAENISAVEFDPQRAAKILDSLGWVLPAGASPGTPEYLRSKDEQVLSLSLVLNDNTLDSSIAEMIKTSWELIGIRVNLNRVDTTTLLSSHLEPRDFEVALTHINLMRFPDPDPYPFWHDSQVEAGQNYSGFSDRNISIWLEQARITPELSRRAELYRSYQYRFQDQAPSLLLYYEVYNYAIDVLVQGVSIGPLFDPSDRFNNIENWHLIARRNLGS
jgi:peptide/nickel transport system substrate-binding protein